MPGGCPVKQYDKKGCVKMDFLEAVKRIDNRGGRIKRDNWDGFLYIDDSVLRIVTGDYYYLDEDSRKWTPDVDDILADDWKVF